MHTASAKALSTAVTYDMEPAFSQLAPHLQPAMRRRVIENPGDFNAQDLTWAQYGVIRATAEDVEAYERAYGGTPQDDEFINADGPDGPDSGEDGEDGEEGSTDDSIEPFQSWTERRTARWQQEQRERAQGSGDAATHDDVVEDELDATGDIDSPFCEMLDPDAWRSTRLADCEMFGGDAEIPNDGTQDKGSDIGDIEDDKTDDVVADELDATGDIDSPFADMLDLDTTACKEAEEFARALFDPTTSTSIASTSRRTARRRGRRRRSRRSVRTWTMPWTRTTASTRSTAS